jgi:hypothetical protein
MKLYVKIALFVVSFIAIAAILAGLYMFNLKHTDMAKANPDFIITATVLQKEFEDNQTAASAKYINKILEITGIIASTTPADNKNLNIELKTGNSISSVICTLPAITDTSKFKSGDEITLRGECSGFTQLFQGEPPLDVLINNCAIILKRK